MSNENKFPTEKSAFYLALTAIVASSFFSAYSIWQNSKNIEMTRTALEISIEPSVDVRLYEHNDRVIIQNTSAVELTDVRPYPVCYQIKKENNEFKIIDRQPLTPVWMSIPVWKPKEEITISLDALSCAKLPKVGDAYINALVIAYRRLADNKRFLKIEPFIMSSGDVPATWASAIDAESGWGGDPALAIGISEKIRQTETAFFRVDK